MKIALSVAILALTVGCHRSDPSVRVEGTVTLDGQPVPECNVVFVPTGLRGRAVSGRTSTTGWFELRTEPADYTLLFNLLPAGGANDVELKAESTRGIRNRQMLPGIYGDAALSPWKVRVPVDAPLVLELQSQDSARR